MRADALLTDKTEQEANKLELLVAGDTATEDENWAGIAAFIIAL